MEYIEHQVDDQVKEDEHQVEEDEVVWVYVFTLLFIHYSKLLK